MILQGLYLRFSECTTRLKVLDPTNTGFLHVELSDTKTCDHLKAMIVNSTRTKI